MTDIPRDTWLKSAIAFIVRAFVRRGRQFQNQREELFRELFDNAEALDDGALGEYDRDERDSVSFEKLHYAPERQEWLARFIPAHPETSADPTPVDVTYTIVEAAYSMLHRANTKPSQALKALAAFHKRFDIEVAKLEFK